MVAATKGVVGSMHAAILDLQREVDQLRSQVLELMETRAEVERLRAQSSAAVARADALAEEVRSQDERIADLEALEGYGWRAPPVYEPAL